jgi:hypothetical protein
MSLDVTLEIPPFTAACFHARLSCHATSTMADLSVDRQPWDGSPLSRKDFATIYHHRLSGYEIALAGRQESNNPHKVFRGLRAGQRQAGDHSRSAPSGLF